MRISLLVGSTLYPLAGEAGVSERTHSSAANYRLEPVADMQTDLLVRGTARRHTDRGNLGVEISFSTTRSFDTAEAAMEWAHDYDITAPRAGTLVLESPARSGYADSLTVAGDLTTDGSTPAVIPEMTYAGISYSKPYFEDEADNNTLVAWTGTVWVLELSGFGALATSTADVASPEMVPSGAWDATTNPHAWKPEAPATGTPVVSAYYPGRRYVENAVVSPPRRRITGCTVMLDYAVSGGMPSDAIPGNWEAYAWTDAGLWES
jgi:hypothetical protein